MHKRYFTNDQGTTVCVMSDFNDVLNETIFNQFITMEPCAGSVPYFETVNTDTIRSFSTVSDQDKYSEDKGGHLASSRADKVYHKMMIRDLMRYRDQLMRSVKEIDRLVAKHDKAIHKIEKHIDNLIDS